MRNGEGAGHAGDAQAVAGEARETDAGATADACVYTVLLGGYERLNEQPVAARSSLRFICLTDDPGLGSDSWEIRQVAPVFARDPIRSQRDLKLRPHLHLPGFARSVYIDNSVVLKERPETLLDMASDAPDGLLMPPHSYRETVLDEFLEVARLGLDDQARIFEQLNHYLLTCPEVLEERPWWSAIMVRDHRRARLRAALDAWALHVMRYSRRDQLSVNMALRMAGIRPMPLRVDNYASDLHTWPHVPDRDRMRGERDIARSMMPVVARLRAAETEAAARAQQAAAATEQAAEEAARAAARLHAMEERLRVAEDAARAEARDAAERAADLAAHLAEARAAREAVLRSTSWRLTAPLRGVARLSPGLARALRGALRPAWRAVTGRRRPALVPSAPPAEAPLASAEPPSPDRVMTRAGHWIHVDPADERGRRLVAAGGSLNTPTLLAWDLLLAEGGWTHVVDVGANYGEMLVNGGLPRDARIVAIEPNPAIRVRLERTLREAGLAAEILDVALSATEGEAALLVDAAWSGTTRLARPEDGAGLPVRTTTLAAVLRACGTPPGAVKALLKIDVEGHEAEVLRGVVDDLPALGGFAALVEVLHGAEAELAWMERHFDVALLEPGATPRLVRAPRGRLREMLASGRFYPQDVVLRRRAV